MRLWLVLALLLPVAASARPKVGLEVVDQGPAVPSDPYDYEANATWSPPPVQGFRELFVDPEAWIGDLVPVAPVEVVIAPIAPVPAVGMPVAAGPGDAEVVTHLPIPKPQPMVPPTGDLVFVNDASGWATVSVNGERVGILGPLATGRLHGVRSGGYDVTLSLSSGYTRTERVQTVLPGAE